MKTCKHCHIELSKGSQHQKWCEKQPGGKPSGNRKGMISWNSGLSGDDRLKHRAESILLMSKKRRARPIAWDKDNAKKISETVNKKVKEGNWHTSLSRKMHINYNGFDLHGSWELAYAKYLDSNSIKWKRCKESFTYEFGGKSRKYTPDFYLIDSDEYVEIKGFKTEKDSAKWEQFPTHRKLIVLMSKNLKELKIIP